MVNKREPAINLVIPDMPKMLTGMSQNDTWAVFGLDPAKAWTTSPSGNNRHLTFLFVTCTEHGKPVHPPARAGRPQGQLLDVRVAEAGESECRSVIERIGTEGLPRHHPARKGADFRLVSHRKITDRTFLKGTRQMTVTTVTGAAPGSEVDWHSIDWAKAHQTVRRLQVRIAKAVRDRRWNKVKALQWLLTHSFCGKAMAVKRVTENRGKRTPGVDGETWSTPATKAQAVMSLRRRGYRPRPLRRMFIPKANGKSRPLGIPTMLDRAQQALHLLALEPVAETTADPNSYGFRPMRSCRDAAGQCFIVLATRRSPTWILDADISSCFDKISHDWMLANIPTDKVMLQKWLKSGFVWKNQLFPTDAGTPQGGIISPTVMNMTLDGMETMLRRHFGARGSKKAKKNQVNLVRYADDLLATGANKDVLEEARSLIEAFLQERGLSLSPEKTKIVHIDDGFDFLGWNLRKYGGKLLITPAKKNVQAHSRKIRETIQQAKTAKQEEVIVRLNPIIRGWANYHQNQVATKTFKKVDNLTWRRLWRWACRRHPKKSKTWIKKRYFLTEGIRNWVFGTKVTGPDGKVKRTKLAHASDTPIQRHIKIKGEAKPFDPAWEPYFEQRLGQMMKNSLKGRERLLRLWQAQKQRCPNCGEPITMETGWHVHHILAKAQGGTDHQANLMLLHPNCHRQIHHSDQDEQPAPIIRGFEEARAACRETDTSSS